MKLTWHDYDNTLQDTPNLNCPQPHELNTDTRNLRPGQWFLPLKGKKFDGHTLIPEAIQKGCRGYFSEQDIQHPTGVLVKSTLQSYQNAALAWRRQSSATCIALTGSVGKTTTREMLACAFQEAGPVLKTSENNNNEIGVPKTLLEINKDHRTVLIEIGARHVDDIGALTPFVEAEIGICLGAADSHLEIFGSHDNLVRTKSQIFQHSKTKFAIVPMDQAELVEKAKATHAQVITFGTHLLSDVRICNFKRTEQHGLKVSLSVYGSLDLFDIELPIFHQAWSHNIAAVCATAIAAGLPLEKVRKGLAHFQGVEGRFHITKTETHTIIDDTYNASPASMRAGLKTLHSWLPQPLTLLLGDMSELGPDEVLAHQELAADINALNPQQVITVGRLTKNIKLAKKINHIHVDCAKNVDISLLSKHALVYAKASNGIGLKNVLNRLHAYMKDSSCSTT
ncbi:MAG: UDP-N-acetylmuramoyl-tripeptide--D-alanyl-D-alanine ligase [Oligoflexales bacterium]